MKRVRMLLGMLALLLATSGFASEYQVRVYCIGETGIKEKLMASSSNSVKIYAGWSNSAYSYTIDSESFNNLNQKCDQIMAKRGLKNISLMASLYNGYFSYESLTPHYPLIATLSSSENFEILEDIEDQFVFVETSKPKIKFNMGVNIIDNYEPKLSPILEERIDEISDHLRIEGYSEKISVEKKESEPVVEEVFKPEEKITLSPVETFKSQVNRNHQLQRTQELYAQGFVPVKSIIISGITFFITDKFIEDVKQGMIGTSFGNRVTVTKTYFKTVFFADRGDGIYLPRFAYLSNSDGTWRSCPEKSGGIFSKGLGIHYTQETMFDERILNTVNELFNSSVNFEDAASFAKRTMSISTFFSGIRYVKGLYTFDTETSVYNDSGTLSFLQSSHLSPGRMSPRFKNSMGSEIRSLDSKLLAIKGFIPDYTKDPVGEYKTFHTLFSAPADSGKGRFKYDITMRVFAGSLNGETVHWYMASDRMNRIWIEKIVFASGRVNSYGVKEKFIHSGPVTNKPLEYQQQSRNLIEGSEKVMTPLSGNLHFLYVDISPLLDNLLPVKLYRSAYKLNR